MIERRLGPYALLAEIGRGSFGVVLRARDLRSGQLVAIKRLLGRCSELDLARFQQEAQAGQRVRHPNVAALLDTGQDALGPYLVFELVEGRDLGQVLRTDGPLPDRRVAELGLALTGALAHAHAQGVLHRDLKPSNVLLDGDGRPRLTDFGLARLAGRGQSLTATGDLLGTPVYMAPEQAMADKARVGPATDVYGLGATLFALLTGRPPALGANVTEVLQAVVHDPPPAPHQLRPAVDRELSRLVLRCLEKAPEDRFAGMPELGAALEAWLTRHVRPVAATEPRRAKAPRRPRRAVPWLPIAGAALGALAALGGGGLAVMALTGPAPVEPGAALAPQVRPAPAEPAAQPPAPDGPPAAAPEEEERERRRRRGLELLDRQDLERGFAELAPLRGDPRLEGSLAERWAAPGLRRLLWLAFVPEAGPLEEAALLVSQLVLHPELDVERNLALLDALAARIGPRVRGRDRAERFASLVALVNAEGARAAPPQEYADPDNSCLDQVLTTGRGIQITCSLVLIAVARRTGVELQGVCYPGRFLVRHPDPPLLLADVFEGSVLTLEQVRQEQGRGWSPQLVEASPRRLILIRLSHFLGQRLTQRQEREAAARATELVLALAPRETDQVVGRAFGGQ